MNVQFDQAKSVRNDKLEKYNHHHNNNHSSNSSSSTSSTETTINQQSNVNLVNDDKHSGQSNRARWGSKWEFLLSCVGLSVGIGNVWRFPYLAYENGGGAFLIPYLIMLTLAGKPMYFMELVIGQFASKGPLSIWSCCPIAKGVGASMACVCFIVCIFYNVVLSYAVYFIGAVFRYGLPWTSCDHDWAIGTNCQVRSGNVSCYN